jgi:ribosomal protein S26
VGFEGDKLTVISEFAVKTVLEKFKMAIEKGGHTPYDEASYRSRVYATLTTLNIRCISYVAENSQKRTVPRRYNNIQYCTSKMDV